MPKFEFNPFPKIVGPDNGGSISVPTEEGDGFVTFTRYGEMVCEITDQGGLIVEFPEHGMTMYYNDEGDLEMSAMDVGMFLSGLEVNQVKKLPNKGENIYGMVQYLAEKRLSMVAYMTIKSGDFEVALINENGEAETVSEQFGVDFSTGLTGNLGISTFKLPFEFTDYGDDVLMSLGESDQKNEELVGVEFSHHVDFEDAIFGEDPKRFHALASQIILQ